MSAERSDPSKAKSDRLEFLKLVEEAEDRRREGVETKASYLLATNAILLVALVGFLGSTSFSTGSSAVRYWLQVAIVFVALACMVISTIFAANVLSPCEGEHRKKIMDLPSEGEERNLFFFLTVSEYRKAQYLEAVASLTSDEILEQLSIQIHNLSRLLRQRYNSFYRAYVFFRYALLAFTILVAASFIR